MDSDSNNLIIEIKEEVQEYEINPTTPPPPPSAPVSHLGVLFVATAGQNGPNLGCDEEEIVLLVLSIVKISTNEVVVSKSFVVQPHTSDINENLLSEECKADFKLCEEQVKNAKMLEEVIEQLDDVVSANTSGSGEVFVLVVDGQLPLRQCLHPETSAKEITLPEYYNSFFDLRKEFNAAFNHIPESIEEMLKHLNINIPESNPEDEHQEKMNEMTSIVQQLISDGHLFENPELINMKLEPGLCSKNEEVDGQTVVRARGLPWQSSDADIAKFFRGLNIAKGGVALCLSPQGRRNGEALIRFESQEHRDMALRRHKHHIGNRYIEVYKATGEDFIAVAGGLYNEGPHFLSKKAPASCLIMCITCPKWSNNEAQAFLIKGGQVIIRMRGLPYDCTAKQVLEFFDSGDNPCQVLDDDEGVLFVRRPDGRATGDAFVLFTEESDAGKALSKHRESIGSRYIELFRSTTAEVQQVLNRCLEATKSAEVSPQLPLATPTGQSNPSISQVPPVTVSIMPQHMITAGTRKDCVRLRGLPYEAQVEHILEFLGEHAKNIVYQGVHMVYNAQGQPSGEAFIQMGSEQSAFLAAQAKHHRYMVYFKKQRYIEVFQCSGEDMNMVLTGGIPLSPQKTLVSPGRTLLAPAPFGAYSYAQGPHHHPAVAPMTPRNGTHPYAYPQIFYWPYPSPPVSPTTYYGTPVTVATQALIPQECMGALSLGSPIGKSSIGNHHNHHYTDMVLPQMSSNGGMGPEMGQRLLNGDAFRTELSLSDKHRNVPALLPTKNYAELPLFIA